MYETSFNVIINFHIYLYKYQRILIVLNGNFTQCITRLIFLSLNNVLFAVLFKLLIAKDFNLSRRIANKWSTGSLFIFKCWNTGHQTVYIHTKDMQSHVTKGGATVWVL